MDTAMRSWALGVQRLQKLEQDREELLRYPGRNDAVRDLDRLIELERALLERLLWVASAPSPLL